MIIHLTGLSNRSTVYNSYSLLDWNRVRVWSKQLTKLLKNEMEHLPRDRNVCAKYYLRGGFTRIA